MVLKTECCSKHDFWSKIKRAMFLLKLFYVNGTLSYHYFKVVFNEKICYCSIGYIQGHITVIDSILLIKYQGSTKEDSLLAIGLSTPPTISLALLLDE